MNIQLGLAPIIALIAGILILVRPRLLNYIVAVYLILIGVLGLVGTGGMNLHRFAGERRARARRSIQP
jgi:hypothetical protein